MDSERMIELEGVRVHNLKNIGLKIRHGALTVICGVSGSGKSSLAFDTLYAEGQRRYIETFSPYARQFLDRVERPDADRIDGIPPAIAVRQHQTSFGQRSTVGTRTEILDYLRQFFVKAGSLVCPKCRIVVRSDTADSAAARVVDQCPGTSIMIAFPWSPSTASNTIDRSSVPPAAMIDELRRRGFVRVVVGEKIVRLDALSADDDAMTRIGAQDLPADDQRLIVIMDRRRVDLNDVRRLAESIEAAMAAGRRECLVFSESGTTNDPSGQQSREIDGRLWQQMSFSGALRCESCRRVFAEPSKELLNFNSVAGACPRCEGLGTIRSFTFRKLVPKTSLSLRDGAVELLQLSEFSGERKELLRQAARAGIPVDLPVNTLSEQHQQLIEQGIPGTKFDGLSGLYSRIADRSHEPGIRQLLKKWQGRSRCPECYGHRLGPNAAAVRVSDFTLADLDALEVSDLAEWVSKTVQDLPANLRFALRSMTDALLARLGFLQECGLGYLTIGRATQTLSGGESQRVMLTSALGSGLIKTLYVLDEPTSGLHVSDTERVIGTVRRLVSSGNTVVVVEHDPAFIRAADDVIEIGPAGGNGGGEIVFHGTPSQLANCADSPTGQRLCAAESPVTKRPIRRAEQWLQLSGVNCHNLVDLDVPLPLGVICAVTGVSGSGKSSLIAETLYPAIAERKGLLHGGSAEGRLREINGLAQIDHVMLLDQQPLKKSSRSIPATWMGFFGEIRKMLATTHEARKRNYTPGTFSYNSAAGGRCPQCEGRGTITVEMQFLADIETVCEECDGQRYRADVLEVRFRDRSIHEILQMTGDDAFSFFNGHRRIQQPLNAVRRAGLGYLRLGQPLSTLSGGEAQRLRIAALLAGVPMNDGESVPGGRDVARRSEVGRTLFLFDEPSAGLHLKDIDRLMNCLQDLVETGNSVIVIEHDEYLLRQTDYRIELGPGPGKFGGRVVYAGPAADFPDVSPVNAARILRK